MKRLLNKGQWEKGNGILVLGTFMMLVGMFIAIMFIQVFTIREKAFDTQSAADSIADGTAVYMMNEGGNDYDKATKKANEIKDLVNVNTKANVSGVTIKKEDIEKENTVAVSLNSNTIYSPIFQDRLGTSYTINKVAKTKYSLGVGLIPDGQIGTALEWGNRISSNDSIGYVWGACGPNSYDCSGFVGQALIAAGICPGGVGTRLFTTANEANYLLSHGFTEVTSSCNLRTGDGMYPGDVLLNSHHTELYYGNGKQIGAHNSDTTKPNQISVVNLYSTWERVFRYTGGQ